jgi:hypothetical protein
MALPNRKQYTYLDTVGLHPHFHLEILMAQIMFKQTLKIKINVYMCVVIYDNPLNLNNENSDDRKGAVYFLLIHSLQRSMLEGIRWIKLPMSLSNHVITAHRGRRRERKRTHCFPTSELGVQNEKKKQEVLGRTNRLLSLIRHGPH